MSFRREAVISAAVHPACSACNAVYPRLSDGDESKPYDIKLEENFNKQPACVRTLAKLMEAIVTIAFGID